jgi:hypothetical protein
MGRDCIGQQAKLVVWQCNVHSLLIMYLNVFAGK